jgi:tetratricopeptide (TPR) repeat protein
LTFADVASGRLESAQTRLDELNVAATSDPHVVIAAGELALVRNDLQQANELLKRALDMAPQLAAAHLAFGHLMESTGDLAAAQSSYEKAAQLQPDRTPGWLKLAALHFRQDHFAEAMEAFQHAEKCRGNQPLAETRMGEAYYLRGDVFAAHKQFTAAVERKSDDPFPRLRVAQILARVGRPTESRGQLEQILAAQEYPAALQMMAESELVASNLESAVKYYQRGLKAKPEDWVAANNLALLLVQTKGPADEAVKVIQLALEHAPPGVASIKGTQGCVLWYAGRLDEAEPLLKQAIAAAPNYSWTRYCYGRVLAAQQRTAEAREQFEACLFLDPTFARRDEVTQILAKLPRD